VSVSLRPFLPADAPALARLFRESVEILAKEEYTDDQRAAWAAASDDVAAFAQKLANSLTLVAIREREIAGFASFNNGHLDLLYVSPDHAREGVATTLVDAIEKLAVARGLKEIETDASDVAHDFFKGRGYVATQRNTVSLNGEWFANTTMKKQLAPAATHGKPN